MFGLKRIIIAQHERGLLFRNRSFEAVLEPGVHRIFDPLKRVDVQVYDLGVPEFEHPRVDFLVKEARATIARYFTVAVQDVLHDEAYPTLGCSVAAFVERYLRAPETILVLQGSPGSGKTRLVRSILGAISKRRAESAEVMYTADQTVLGHDEVFVQFITGSYAAFVIEDADLMLKSSTTGNANLQRFLAIADGVIRAQGRKIIFTTNLPNVGDIDEALLRPGRCFAVIPTRALDRDEIKRLVARLCGEGDLCQAVMDRVLASGARATSVASVYRVYADALRA